MLPARPSRERPVSAQGGLGFVSLKWTLNTSGYVPEVYRISDFELGEDYY
jgi:hypothetical protein